MLQRGGTMAALSALVDAHYHAVLQTLTRLCGSPLTAEELAQETFMGLARSWSPLSTDADDRAYLIRAAYNAWRRSGRTRRPETIEPELLDELCRERVPVLDQLCTHEDIKRVYAALYRLPENHRAAFVLIVLQGMEYNEAANLMGVPRATVSKWRSRAVHGIRTALTTQPSGTMETASWTPT